MSSYHLVIRLHIGGCQAMHERMTAVHERMIEIRDPIDESRVEVGSQVLVQLDTLGEDGVISDAQELASPVSTPGP